MSSPKLQEISVLAPAKVNLFLQIIGRRDDGFHLIESLFAFADFGDTLTVRRAEKLSFRVSGPFAGICEIAGCDGKTNLVYKAAEMIAPLTPGKGAEIILEKNLPLSSGLGGGSSDAAAALKALQLLWEIEIDEKQLFQIASELGADVPACMLGKPCFVSGIGETISPLEKFKRVHAVLVNPLKPLATPQVFRAFKGRRRPFSPPLALSGAFNRDQGKLLHDTHNDLQGPAISLCHDIARVLKALAGCEGVYLTRMSGSGATCFGLFEKKNDSEKAAAWLAREHSTWWVQACSLKEDIPFLLSTT